MFLVVPNQFKFILKLCRTPEEMIMTRKNLRKVNITRSPGGTPLVSDRNYENGTGLTPMMTKALQRKFQVMLMYMYIADVT